MSTISWDKTAGFCQSLQSWLLAPCYLFQCILSSSSLFSLRPSFISFLFMISPPGPLYLLFPQPGTLSFLSSHSWLFPSLQVSSSITSPERTFHLTCPMLLLNVHTAYQSISAVITVWMGHHGFVWLLFYLSSTWSLSSMTAGRSLLLSLQ